MFNFILSFFSRYKRLIFFVLFIMTIGYFYYFARDYITTEKLKESSFLLNYVGNHYALSVIMYILFFACVLMASLPFVAPMAITGGYLFGTFHGFIYSLIGTTLGGISAYFILRYFMTGKTLEKNRKKFANMEQKIKKNGVSYLLVLQLLSVVPFFIINTIAILAEVSLFTVVWTTIIGGTPTLLLYSFAGNQLKTVGSVGDIFSPPILIAFGLLITLIVIGPLLFKKFNKGSID